MKEKELKSLIAFSSGMLLALMMCFISLVINYKKLVDKEYLQEKIIEQCIQQYPDFMDTIGETDEWYEMSSM